MNISTISQTSGATDLVMEVPTLPENREMDGSISPATRIGQLFIPHTAYFAASPAQSFTLALLVPGLGYLVYKVAQAMYNWATQEEENQAQDENQLQAVNRETRFSQSNEYGFTHLTRCIDLQ